MKTDRLFVAIVAAAVFASCGTKEEKTEVREELPLVAVDVVHSQQVPQTKEYTATVQAENLNNITPSSPNRIKKINVEVGDRVRTGQVLVTLDSSNSDQLRINLDQIEREYNRAVQLLEIGGGTRQAVDQLKAQLDAARSQYDNIMENTVLRSPISGLVTVRNYDPGDMTSSLPILTVGQLSPVVKVMINVSENDMSKIAVGMPVEIAFDAFPEEKFSGKIYRVYPTVDESTRTFGVEIRIPNPKEQLKPGMFARVTIDFGSAENVVVPDRAVVKQTGSGNKYVYVLHGNTVSYNKVEIGLRLGSSYELLSGVNNGDTVVIAGQTRLADGVQVEVQH